MTAKKRGEEPAPAGGAQEEPLATLRGTIVGGFARGGGRPPYVLMSTEHGLLLVEVEGAELVLRRLLGAQETVDAVREAADAARERRGGAGGN